MKRPISIALATLYLFNLFGYMGPFLTAQAQIRKEIKKRIKQSVPDQELVLISVTPEMASSLQWIKSFEFRYRGGLYDVVRSRPADDTIHYYCINDLQEERLFAGLDELVRRQMESGTRAPSRGSQPGTPGSQEHMPPTPMDALPVAVVCTVNPRPSPLPPSLTHDVPVPPPRVV